MANREGPLAGDRRHQLKAFGSYEFELPNDMRLNLGGVCMARSGDPSNYLGAHPIYGQNEAYLLPRGSGPRLPWMFSMDARAVYGIKFGEARMVEVSLDVFNIFNFQAEVSRDQTYTSSDVLPIENGTEADLATKIRHASSTDPSCPARSIRLSESRPLISRRGTSSSAFAPPSESSHDEARSHEEIRLMHRPRRCSPLSTALVVSSCDQPPVLCTSGRGDFAAQYTFVSGDAACNNLKSEILGMNAYSFEKDGVDSGTMADWNAELGRHRQRAHRLAHRSRRAHRW